MITKENLETALADINKDFNRTSAIQTGVSPDGEFAYASFSYTFTWSDPEKTKEHLERILQKYKNLYNS